jgi:hypothetical protein
MSMMEDDQGELARKLPSWVIDWRVTSRCFSRWPMQKQGKMEMAWYYFASTPSDAWPLSDRWQTMSAPPSHEDFCADNTDPLLPLPKLVVRGFVCHAAIIVHHNLVLEKQPFGIDEILWGVHGAAAGVIVVYLTDFVGNEISHQDPPTMRRGL